MELTYKFLYFQSNIQTYRDNVVEYNQEGEDILKDIDCSPGPIISKVPVVGNLCVFMK